MRGMATNTGLARTFASSINSMRLVQSSAHMRRLQRVSAVTGNATVIAKTPTSFWGFGMRSFSIIGVGNRTLKETEKNIFSISNKRDMMKLQRRSLFIQTEETPNPASLKFLPGCTVLEAEFGKSMDFRRGEKMSNSPLAKLLFRVNGVEGVFFGSDFITVSKAENLTWAQLKPDIFATMMDFFAAGKTAVTGEKVGDKSQDADSDEEDDEVVSIIKMLLEDQIRPMVQEDGGDIFFQSFDKDSGVVKVKLAGSCAGCPSSTVTLKNGVEKMLMWHIPEITRVDEVLDEEEVNERKLTFNPTD